MTLLEKLVGLHKTTNAAVIIAVTFFGFIAFMGYVFIDHERQVNQMSEVVQKNLQSSKKMQLLSELMEMARARTRLTSQILDTDDPFVQDELNTKLERFASQFARNRQQLLDMELAEEERRIMERQNTIVPVILPNQRKAVELAMYGDEESLQEAERILYDIVLPGQGQMIDLFAELVSYEQESINQLSEKTILSIQDSQQRHGFIALTALVIASIFSALVIIRVRNIQLTLERSHELLEGAVAERTNELRRAQEMLQTVLDTIPVRVFWKSHGGKYLGCNTLFAQDAGLDHPDSSSARTTPSWYGTCRLSSTVATIWR